MGDLYPDGSIEEWSVPLSLVGATRPEVEVIKLISAKIYRFLQLLSHSCGFFARV